MIPQSNSRQRTPGSQRRIPSLPQTARPRAHRQPLQLPPAHPHQALPRPLRARQHALRAPLRHRHRNLACHVRLPDRLALPALLPNLRYRRHGIRDGWRRIQNARRPQRDVCVRLVLPGCFPSCSGAGLRCDVRCACAAETLCAFLGLGD